MELKTRIVAALVACMSAAGYLHAEGSIVGKVSAKGEENREALPGVTVLLQGTVRGTSTNTKGEYRIAGLPEGTYTLVFSMVGYERLEKTGVVVENGKDVRVDVQLGQVAVPMDQVVVTATKRQQSLSDVPVSVTVIDSRQIARRNALTLDDAMRYVPGVNMTGSQINIRGSSGYNRGAGSRVLMLLDGIPLITGDTGELNFETIPIGEVERVEVVKGASSALYGSNALGGVINVITREIPDHPETDVGTYVGFYSDPSRSQWKWSAVNRYYNGQSISHSYRVGDIGVSFFFSRQFDDGYRKNDYRRRYNFYTKFKEDFGPSSSLTLHFGLLDQYGGQYLYWRNLDSALLPPLAQADDIVKSNRYFASATYNRVISQDLLVTTSFLWYHNVWGFETRAGIGRAESDADDLRWDFSATDVINETHTLTAGGDVTGDIIGGRVLEFRRVGGFALFAQDEIMLEKALTVTAGLRYDFQAMGLTTPGGKVTPKVAARYTVADGTTLRASVTTGFRVPSVTEAFIQAAVSNLATFPGGDLKPEKSTSYEVGIVQTIGSSGNLDFALFRTDYDNLIEPQLTQVGSSLGIQWRNVADARIQGGEVVLGLGFFDGLLSSSIGYTYVYPEDRTRHDILRYRPRHVLYTNLLGHIGPVMLTGDFRFMSKPDRIDEELMTTGIVPDGDARVDVLVTDVRAGTDFTFLGVNVNATFSVNNLFQYNYTELIGNIMPPRTYVLALHLKP
jgi:outer membrane receptor for ferrienterochelin and colicins